MTTTQQTVVAVFNDRTQAEQAINELQDAGISSDQIRFAGQGASTRGFLESIKSLFTGHQTGRAYDDLVALGVSPDDASYYQQEYEAGRSIVAVLAGERIQEVTSILTRYGGYTATQRFSQTTDYADTASTGVREAETGGEQRFAQTTDYADTTSTGVPQAEIGGEQRFAQTTDYADTASTGVRETETEGQERLKLREEQLRAQKQPVETGEVRLRKDVVTEQKSIEVPVTREEVYIERRPGSGQPADQPIGEGETYRVPVREEQVTVEKQPVVREEIALGKRPVQETKQVSDTVRREEAHIERAGDVDVQGSDVQDISDQTNQTDQTAP